MSERNFFVRGIRWSDPDHGALYGGQDGPLDGSSLPGVPAENQ